MTHPTYWSHTRRDGLRDNTPPVTSIRRSPYGYSLRVTQNGKTTVTTLPTYRAAQRAAAGLGE